MKKKHKYHVIQCVKKIYKIMVEKNGLYYDCQFINGGWKCGKCERGNFSIFPEMLTKCKVCKAVVRTKEYEYCHVKNN